jgi:hypothetical protein
MTYTRHRGVSVIIPTPDSHTMSKSRVPEDRDVRWNSNPKGTELSTESVTASPCSIKIKESQIRTMGMVFCPAAVLFLDPCFPNSKNKRVTVTAAFGAQPPRPNHAL